MSFGDDSIMKSRHSVTLRSVFLVCWLAGTGALSLGYRFRVEVPYGAGGQVVIKDEASLITQVLVSTVVAAAFSGLVVGVLYLTAPGRSGEPRRGLGEAEPGAPPKAGPAMRPGNLGSGGGPPSVS